MRGRGRRRPGLSFGRLDMMDDQQGGGQQHVQDHNGEDHFVLQPRLSNVGSFAFDIQGDASLRQNNVETHGEPGGLVEAVLSADEEVETRVSAQAAAHPELSNEAARGVAEGFAKQYPVLR